MELLKPLEISILENGDGRKIRLAGETLGYSNGSFSIMFVATSEMGDYSFFNDTREMLLDGRRVLLNSWEVHEKPDELRRIILDIETLV